MQEDILAEYIKEVSHENSWQTEKDEGEKGDKKFLKTDCKTEIPKYSELGESIRPRDKKS